MYTHKTRKKSNSCDPDESELKLFSNKINIDCAKKIKDEYVDISIDASCMYI